MTLEEIKNWSSSCPAEVQQVIWELVEHYQEQFNVQGECFMMEIDKARRQAFLEAAEVAENEYTGPGHNLAYIRAICFVIAKALRQRAGGEKM